MRGPSRLRIQLEKIREYIKERRTHCQGPGCGRTDKLTFHHRDPAEKSFTIGNLAWGRAFYGFKRLQEEIDKCDVLCEDCHKKKEKELKRSRS